jgi:spermidine synthase
LLVQSSVDVLLTERNFFGINRVKLIEGGVKTALIHGTTMHGTEFTAPNRRRQPLAYYARSGPVGQVMALAGPRRNVAAIGLGTGALACYRKPGEHWTFFEIDSAVEKIARDTRYFHYLSDCGVTKIVLGDGRLSLKASPDHSYDLIIVDAFSSDSIPMHLLTREAVSLYLSKLKPRGVILFNISNEYLELAPVLTTLVKSVGAAGRHQLFQPSPAEVAQGATASEWVAIAASDADLDFLRSERRWQAMGPAANMSPWTDDFSNIIGAIHW